MAEIEKSSSLFGPPESEYGQLYKAHLLDQYKMYVEMTDRVSQRRITTNSYMLTVNATIIALFSLLFTKVAISWYGVVLFSIAGCSICLAWFIIINSYKQLNALKFMVIHELETKLPAKLYDYEWVILKQKKAGAKYLRLTKIEKIIPLLFLLVYVAVGCFSTVLGK